MAPYKRLSIAGHYDPARGPRTARHIAATPMTRRSLDPRDAQPVQGMLIAIPLGLACWGAIGGLGLLVANLIG